MTEKKMTLADWLDDLCVRFIVNLPREELVSVERICFQVEEAQWFYEDFIRPLDPELPSLNLRNFCLLIFQHCPMFSGYPTELHEKAFEEFLAYKTRVPVRGAIMMNQNMDEVLLVKGWKKGANWSFPRGKINKDEPDLDCAVREVDEETGYDIKGAGLVGDEEDTKYIEMNLREQNMRLYVFRGVPMDTKFEPKTRKEISKIQWWKLSDLPTLKKKKQQPETQGGDPANNANKFYMVAPFLPQLKKWISGQRKLDKTRPASISAPIVDNAVVESETVEEPDTVDETNLPSSDGNMSRLLNSLRQSAQAADPDQLPVPTIHEHPVEGKAAQLKSFLGVPNATSTAPDIKPQASAAEPTKNIPDSSSLLALLQSKPSQSTKPPQTPMDQVIEHPKQPPSPVHPQDPFSLDSQPPPPHFPPPNILAMASPQESKQIQQPLSTRADGMGICQIQTRPVPPAQHPPQLIPRPSTLPQKPPPTGRKIQQPIAPYQRTGDPQFAQFAQASGDQPPSIPRASDLPRPKLNAQSSALLTLFKGGPSTKITASNENASARRDGTNQADTAVNDAVTLQASQSPKGYATMVAKPSRSSAQQASHQPIVLLPSQIQPQTLSSKAIDGNKQKTEHHDKLLSLFRTPPTANAAPAKTSNANLQPPAAPIELSALPSTPSHSREPSAFEKPPQPPASVSPQDLLRSLDQGLQKSNTKTQNAPVSATVNGPLNVPQFDMLAKASKEAKHIESRDSHTQPGQKVSPITILPRPTSSTPARAEVGSTPPAKQAKQVAPKIQTFVTPIKKPPPTPDLKGQDAPPKPFQPQILRRPVLHDDSNEPSPIQPLPSPKHNLLPNKVPAKPNEQKKSLLSLFTKPSPIISPPSAAPLSSFDPAALISPLSGPSPQEQADAALSKLKESIGAPSKPVEPSAGNFQLSAKGPNNTTNDNTDGVKSGTSSGKQTPARRSAALDKSFLLGYLEGVAKGGR